MSYDIRDYPALTLFDELLAAPSPSGREEGVAGIIREKLRGWGFTPETDPAGNVLVRLPGRDPQASLCCVSAHMDEIGMVVTRIEPNGELRVDRSGGLHPWKMGERPVQILGDQAMALGVLSMGSAHTASASDRAISWQDVRVITGLSPAQLAVAGIRPGSTAVPVREGRGPVLFGDPADPLVAAWTFDDRMGCVAVLRVLQRMQEEGVQPQHPTIAAFTVHEEGGGQGAKALAMRERPVVFIGIDGCPIPPGTPLAMDGRPGIWSKDRLIDYDQRLLGTLRRAAAAAGTELQPVVYDSAASDASLVASVGAVPRVACFGQVRENSHGYEVARVSVFENMYRTLYQFVRSWQGD